MQALTRAGAAAAARVASVPLPSTATSFRAYSRVPKTPLAQAYHLVLKRNSTYLLFIVGGAVILESIYGTVGDAVWSAANHGVSSARAGHELVNPLPRPGVLL